MKGLRTALKLKIPWKRTLAQFMLMIFHPVPPPSLGDSAEGIKSMRRGKIPVCGRFAPLLPGDFRCAHGGLVAAISETDLPSHSVYVLRTSAELKIRVCVSKEVTRQFWRTLYLERSRSNWHPEQTTLKQIFRVVKLSFLPL